MHYCGNAYGSTLRLSLGCLLSGQLGIQLRRVGSGKRLSFTAEGEDKLSLWMGRNAFVSWVEDPSPWQLEEEALASMSLPLNLRGNENHQFYATLYSMRALAKTHARELPIIPS